MEGPGDYSGGGWHRVLDPRFSKNMRKPAREFAALHAEKMKYARRDWLESNCMVYMRDRVTRSKNAVTFEDEDVARCYSFRPPYHEDMISKLVSLANGRDRALDAGSGPGKIASALGDSFSEVIALEPSKTMIAQGKSGIGGRADKVKWVNSRIEDYDDSGTFSIAAAGNSVHWFDHEIVFPKLADWTRTIAVISGDVSDAPPCGKEKWAEFVAGWLSILSRKDPSRWQRFDPSGFKAERGRHEAWIDITGRREFSYTFRQPLRHFIESQHSQAAWSRKAMGRELSGRFDRELMELMLPYSENGFIELDIVSDLAWGKPRLTPVCLRPPDPE